MKFEFGNFQLISMLHANLEFAICARLILIPSRLFLYFSFIASLRQIFIVPLININFAII